MKNGLRRFNYYLDLVDNQLSEAAKNQSPALWMLQNNSRTPFFMLEALARVYADMHNTKTFTKLKTQFKQIEDGLGKIDHFNEMIDAFAANPQIPIKTIEYLKASKEKNIEDLDQILIGEKWISEKKNKIKKIKKKLKKADWVSAKKEAKAVKKFYQKSIIEITDSLAEKNFHFVDIETDVHELRRDLRWLSIYAQALRGMIQFNSIELITPSLDKYLTDSIVNSPYNQLPEQGELKQVVLVSKNHFLSLSWMIAELGNLKEQGLNLTGLKEALFNSKVFNEEQANVFIKDIKKDAIDLNSILKQSESIVKSFMEEKILGNLLVSN